MSGSAYPVIWAMKHAPVADALERLILIAMADAADADGCNSYRSIRSHMLIAAGVDKSTIIRRQRSLAARGLIRPDTTPAPARYLKIPANRRPARWELCIPYGWWSDAQREEIQREREDRGLPPITAASRPDLTAPPPKKTRADKGKAAPSRGRTKTETARGGTETPQDSEARGGTETPPGVAQRHPQGWHRDTQPSFVYLPVEPSSSYEEAGASAGPSTAGAGEEEGKPASTADILTDAATLRWVGHRRPTPPERARLVERVARALASGATPDGIVYALTRDLGPDQVRTTAVQVVMGRSARPGWADAAPPAAPRPRRTTDLDREDVVKLRQASQETRAEVDARERAAAARAKFPNLRPAGKAQRV